MTGTLRLRRHLYEQLRCGRLGRRQRRALRRQIALLPTGSGPLPPSAPDGGAAGVREPRRPGPRVGPERALLETSPGSPLGGDSDDPLGDGPCVASGGFPGG